MEPISDDLRDLIASFQSHGVEFIVVGAHALALHGYPRNTLDLDLWVRRSEESARACLKTLRTPLPSGGEGQG